MLIAFDDMIADMKANKILSLVVTKLFLGRRKLNIYIPYFNVPKTIRADAILHFIMEIPNNGELLQIALNYLSNIEFKDFMNLSTDYRKETFSLLVNDTALPSENPLRFRKNPLQNDCNREN